MTYTQPTPCELGIKIPPSLREDRFNEGFTHCLQGGRVDRPEHFRLSFRMGFRAGKRYLRELRRRRGIIEFPHRMRVSAPTRRSSTAQTHA